MPRFDRDQLLASINHQLAAIDGIAHRTTLIEEINFRIDGLHERVTNSTVDMEAVSALAHNVQQIVVVLADRLDAIEATLQTLVDRLGPD